MSLTTEPERTEVAPATPESVGAGSTTDGVAGRDLVVGRHRPGLDGLRGIGMAVMLAYHGELPMVRGAFLALSQFFTLSGFLITGILLDQAMRGGIGLRRFWERRFRRLMPAALMTLAGIAVFGATVATRGQAEEIPGHVAAAAGYVANWFFILTDKSYVGLFSAPSPVQHFWSLSIEEQAYLLLPLVLIVLLKIRRSPRFVGTVFVVGAVASSAWMAWLHRSGAGIDRLYYGTDTRLAEILMGGALAIFLYRAPRLSSRTMRRAGTVGLLAYVGSLALFMTVPLAEGPFWNGGLLAFAVLSCAVIFGVLAERGPLVSILSWGPLPAIGRLTYGLYLFHWPIYLWLTAERTGLTTIPLFGLRVAVTTTLAIGSYHLVEMPIRRGAGMGARPNAWLVAAPVMAVIVVAATFALADRSGSDPLATLRTDGSELTVPVVADDGVLDVMVITDSAGAPVARGLDDLAAGRSARMVHAQPFRCQALTGTNGNRTCANWKAEWPEVIRSENPDIVLLYLDDWPTADLERVGPGEDPAAVATEALDNGLDLLTARGAPVLWAGPGTDLTGAIAREGLPFTHALQVLEQGRSDLRRALRSNLPDPAASAPQVFVDRMASAILDHAELYQRAPTASLERVLVIGDSQARSLGYGLERWAATSRRGTVWNVATEGCGLADEGTTRSFGAPTPISERCRGAIAALPDQIRSFDPDLVVVLTSIWDVQDRSHPSWTGFQTMGDPAFERYLRDEYEDIVSATTAEGANVLWMRGPCTRFEPGAGGPATLPAAFDQERVTALNRTVLEPLARAHSDRVHLFDLDAALCPGGSYTNRIDGVDGIRFDGIHFSVDGAMWFADRYGDEILSYAAR